jgi:ADP-ribose pyrophosphatase YjhB (NUDIX family)
MGASGKLPAPGEVAAVWRIKKIHMAKPYQISTLLYCFNGQDEVLLLERAQEPNLGLWSPCGGKLHTAEGESPYACACREAEEELGIVVTIRQKVAEVHFNGNIQYYFLAEKLSGEFGTGTGEEYGDYNPAHGTYHPIWMPLADVLTHNVLPRELGDLVVRFVKEGWPVEPVIIIEEKR